MGNKTSKTKAKHKNIVDNNNKAIINANKYQGDTDFTKDIEKTHSTENINTKSTTAPTNHSSNINIKEHSNSNDEESLEFSKCCLWK